MDKFYESIDKETFLYTRVLNNFKTVSPFNFLGVVQTLLKWRTKVNTDWTSWAELGATTVDQRTSLVLDDKKIVSELEALKIDN